MAELEDHSNSTIALVKANSKVQLTSLPPEIISKIVRWHATGPGQKTLFATLQISIFKKASEREIYRYAFIHSLARFKLFLIRLESDPGLSEFVEELRLSSENLELFGSTLKSVLVLIGERIKFISFGRIAGVVLSDLPKYLVSIDVDDVSFPMGKVDNLPKPIPLAQIERLTVRNIGIVGSTLYLTDFNETLNLFPNLTSLRMINFCLRSYLTELSVTEIADTLSENGLRSLAYYTSHGSFLLALLSKSSKLTTLQLGYHQLFNLLQSNSIEFPPTLRTIKLMRVGGSIPLNSPIAAVMIQAVMVSPITTLVVDYSFYSDLKMLAKVESRGILLKFDNLLIGDDDWKAEWGERIPAELR